MSFAQLLRILRARVWSILATLLVFTTAAFVISLLLPRKYTAVATVVVDARPVDPIAGVILPTSGAIIATQVDVLTSHRVALRVVKALRLDQSEAARQQYMDDTGGAGPFETWLADLLLRNLVVKPARDSLVLDLQYTAVDPKFAAMIANAFVQAYTDVSLEMKVEPARQYAAWFEQRSKGLRDRLEQAQRRLSEYQQKVDIFSVDERLDVETARLGELSQQLVAMQGLSADSRSRQRQVGTRAPETLPEVLTHPLVQNLKSDIARSEAKLKETGGQLGPNHPLIERQEAELAALRARLDVEIKRVVGGIDTASRVSSQREGDVRVQLEAQRAKVMGLKKAREELTVLQQEVENAQKSYDSITSRSTLSSLESQANQTNIYVLSPAAEPNTHSRPRLLLNTVVGAVVGLLLGIGVAAVRELLDRRVRSEEDLDAFELPVLGRVSGNAGRAAPWRLRALRLGAGTVRARARLARPMNRGVGP